MSPRLRLIFAITAPELHKSAYKAALENAVAAQSTKAMAMTCVRNSIRKNLHAGRVLVTRAGDFSDVTLIYAEGNHIPQAELSRLDDDEMRDLMRQVVNRL